MNQEMCPRAVQSDAGQVPAIGLAVVGVLGEHNVSCALGRLSFYANRVSTVAKAGLGKDVWTIPFDDLDRLLKVW
jgi:hypothetical protein